MTTTIRISKFEKETFAELVFLVFDILARKEVGRAINRDSRTYSMANIKRMHKWLVLIQDVLRFPISKPPAEPFDALVEAYLKAAGEIKVAGRKSTAKTNLFKDYLVYIDSSKPYIIQINYTGFVYFDMAVMLYADALVSRNEGRRDFMRLQSQCYTCVGLAINALRVLIEDTTKILSNDLSDCKAIVAYIKTCHEGSFYDLVDKAYFRPNDYLTPSVESQIDIRGYIMNPSSIPNKETLERVYFDLERRINTTPDGKIKELLRENLDVISGRVRF